MSSTSTSPLTELRRLLAIRHCKSLLATRAASMIGDFVTPIALAFAVLQTLHGSPGALGIALAPVLAGTALAVLAGGIVADRAQPFVVMAVADLVRFGVQATACALLVTGSAHLWQLAVLSLLRGLAGGMFVPASRAAWVRVLPKSELQRASALLGLLGGLAVVLGPALAAAALTVTSPGWVIGIDAVTFAFSAVVLFRIRPAGDARPATVRPRLLADVKVGFRHVTARPWLVALLFQAAALHLLVAGPLQTLGPVSAARSYGGAWGLSAFLGGAGLGAMIGGAIAFRLKPARPLFTAAASLLLLAPAPALLALKAPAILVAVAYALAGVTEALYGALWDSTLQRRIPAEVLGRVVSYDSLISLVTLPLGVSLAGAAAEVLGLTNALWVCAVAVPLITLPVLALRSVRETVPSSAVPAPAAT